MQLVIRADANDRIGAGHIMRCATLAQAWLEAGFGTVVVDGTVEIPFVTNRLGSLGITISRSAACRNVDGLLVVDTYDDAERRAAAASLAGCRVLTDDLGGEVPAGYSIVWHPHPDADRNRFPGFTGTIITGPSSIPIRTSLPAWTGGVDSREVAVTLGGGNVSPRLTQALARLADQGQFQFIAAGHWAPSGWERVAAEQMWTRFVQCRCLLTAAGSTVWEAAAVGIPTAIVQTAPNQALIAQWAERSCPVVRFDDESPPDVTMAALSRALRHASPLPRLHDGAPFVARSLSELAQKA